MKRPIKIEGYNLSRLLDFIEKKGVSIPEFQRGWVWREKQVKDLFDSLIKKYPIGSFVIWKTNKRIEPRKLFTNAKIGKEKYFILDGQQRLISIYYLCKQNKFSKIKDLFQEIDESSRKQSLEFEHFYFESKKKPKLKYSEDMTNEFNFSEFKRKVGNEYVFPVITVSMNDFKAAIELFKRINRSGTPISTEAVFLSETWNEKTNLGKILRKWKKKHKGSLSSRIENIHFIHTLGMILQLRGIGCETTARVDISLKNLEKIAENIHRERSERECEGCFRKVLEAVNEAMSFLKREFKISSIDDLPSKTMITLLSVFFYYRGRFSPTKFQKKELKKWFWRSSLGNRYSGRGYTEHTRTDPIKMKDLAKKSKPLSMTKEKIKSEDLFRTDMRTGRSAIRNCIKLMLWSKEPRWINGDVIGRDEVESKKRKKEDDHFYAYDLFKRGCIEEEEDISTILNLIFLSKAENASKQELLPSLWLYKRKRELKSRHEDEQLFFRSNLLPFDDINDIKIKESKLIKRNGKIRPKIVRKYYANFLRKRFNLFEQELDRLQDGK